MTKTQTKEQISNLNKISPSIWPFGCAVSGTSMLLSLVVLVHTPTKIVTFFFGLSLIILIVSLWRWFKLLLNNK